MPTKQADLVIPPDLAKAFEVKELPAVPEKSEEKALGPQKDKTASRKKTPRPAAKKKQKASGKTDELTSPGEQALSIPNRRPVKDPLWVGEKIWMDVSWLNTKAGEFLLEVLPFKVINGRKVYDIKGTARTSDLFSIIYKAEDWVESFVDYEGWFPYKFVLHGDETKHVRDNLELFDHAAKKQYVHIHDNRIQLNEVHEEKGIKDLTPYSQDSLSALYYVRTHSLEEGATIRFPMTTNGSQWETNVIVMGREEVSTKMGYMKAVKTKVETRFRGVLQQQGDAFIWFSDDERKYILRFEAKVKIGWVAGVAKKIEPGAPENPNAEQAPVAPDPRRKTTSSLGPATGKKRLWFQQLLQSVGSGVKKPGVEESKE